MRPDSGHAVSDCGNAVFAGSGAEDGTIDADISQHTSNYEVANVAAARRARSRLVP